MPYIPQEDRQEFAKFGRPVTSRPGELAYALTRLVLGALPNSPRYEDYAEVLGVLESVKLELYRRMVAPYEDRKCEENGDVYPDAPCDIRVPRQSLCGHGGKPAAYCRTHQIVFEASGRCPRGQESIDPGRTPPSPYDLGQAGPQNAPKTQS